MSAVRHARRHVRPTPPLRVSIPTARASQGRPARDRRRADLPRPGRVTRWGIPLVLLTVAIGAFCTAAGTAIGKISTVGGAGSIATVTAPVTVGVQLPGAAAVPPPVDQIGGDAVRAGSVYPGSPPLQVPITIGNPSDVPFTVRSLSPDRSAFPAGCPLTAWQIDAPRVLPALAARGSSTVTVEIGLRAGAPRSCAGNSVTFALTVEGIPG